MSNWQGLPLSQVSCQEELTNKVNNQILHNYQVLLTSHRHVLGVIILLERNVSPCHHTCEGPAGDQAHVTQGELAGGGGGHHRVLKLKKKTVLVEKKLSKIV